MTKTINRTLPTLRAMEELLVDLTSDPNVFATVDGTYRGQRLQNTSWNLRMQTVQMHNHDEYSHHEQSHRVEKSFTKDVQVLLVVLKDLGNPFEEDN